MTVGAASTTARRMALEGKECEKDDQGVRSCVRLESVARTTVQVYRPEALKRRQRFLDLREVHLPDRVGSNQLATKRATSERAAPLA